MSLEVTYRQRASRSTRRTRVGSIEHSVGRRVMSTHADRVMRAKACLVENSPLEPSAGGLRGLENL